MPLKLPKRLQLHPSRQRSKDQEIELASRFGGRKTAASGALDSKGDVRVKGVVRIEAKTTSKKSFPVTREMIRKIEAEAMAADEFPALVVEFIDEKGTPEMECCVVPKWVLDILCEKWKTR